MLYLGEEFRVPKPISSSNSFLLEFINSKLITHAKKTSLAPNFILSLNMSDSAHIQLHYLYPKAKIKSFSLADLKDFNFPVADESIDLLVANFSIAYDFDPDILFANARRILSKDGLFIFSTLDNIINRLNDAHLFYFFYIKEHIITIDFNIFFAANEKILFAIKNTLSQEIIEIKSEEINESKKEKEEFSENEEFEEEEKEEHGDEEEQEPEETEGHEQEHELPDEVKEPEETESKEKEIPEVEEEAEVDKEIEKEIDKEIDKDIDKDIEEDKDNESDEDDESDENEEIDTMADVIEQHKEKLNTHADQISEHLLVSKELSHPEHKIQHNEQHREMLTTYKSLHNEHQQLLSNFISSHEKVLERNPELAKKYHALIEQHKQLLEQHDEKIQQHDEFVNQKLEL